MNVFSFRKIATAFLGVFVSSSILAVDHNATCGTSFGLVDHTLLKQNPVRPTQKASHNLRMTAGQSTTFYTYNFSTKKYEQITATLQYTFGFVNIWVEDAEWSNNHVNISTVSDIAAGLMDQTPQGSIDPQSGILDIIHTYYGPPPNFDQDQITDFVIYDIQDDWEPGKSFIAGYFNPIDQYANGTSNGNSTISNSNERDVLYIDSQPGIFSDGHYHADAVLGTVAHEYQHLVHFNSDREEATAVNEGMSELSSWLCGYGLRNPSRYLFDTNIDFMGWSNEQSIILKHYSKAALWTYFLSQAKGLSFIKNLFNSTLHGATAIESVLKQNDPNDSFVNTLTEFYQILTTGRSRSNPAFEWNITTLQGLIAEPLSEVYDFPSSERLTVAPNALAMYYIENCDSLSVNISGGNPTILWNRYSEFASDLFLAPGFSFSENDFGQTWKNGRLMIMNFNASSQGMQAQFTGRQQYHVVNIDYTTETADLSINSSGNTNVNRFIAPYDSSILRSVSFSNRSAQGPVQIAVYEEPVNLQPNQQPQIKYLQNSLQDGWPTINLTNFDININAGESVDVGVKYENSGVMGYSRQPSGLDHSYIRFGNSGAFTNLNQLAINGEQLDGVWQMNASFFVPLRHKPDIVQPNSFVLERVFPNPFPVPGNPTMRIDYKIQGKGRLKMELFDILGQRVKLITDRIETVPIGSAFWDGTNSQGFPVSSGVYFLSISFADEKINSKITVIR